MVFHNEKNRDSCDRYWSRPLSFLQIFSFRSNWRIGGEVVNQLTGWINQMAGHYWQRAERRALWLVVFRGGRAAGDRQLFGLGRLGQGGREEREGEVDLEQKKELIRGPIWASDSATTKNYMTSFFQLGAYIEDTRMLSKRIIVLRIFICTWI